MNKVNGSHTPKWDWGVRYDTYACPAGHLVDVFAIYNARRTAPVVGPRVLICPLCKVGAERTGSTPPRRSRIVGIMPPRRAGFVEIKPPRLNGVGENKPRRRNGVVVAILDADAESWIYSA